MSTLTLTNGMNRLNDDDSISSKAFDEKIKNLTPSEQEAVKRFWRSLVLRSPRAFSEENGRSPHYAVANGNMRSCTCCPYGYHIDLDFVRYCEALGNAKPSEDELRRRSRRRSLKSMELMLGLDSIFDQWDAAQRVQAVTELPHESEPELPRPRTASSNALNSITTVPCYTLQRQRSASVPRFSTAGGSTTRPESPFGVASSTCSSVRGAESDVPYSSYVRRQNNSATNSQPERRAFLHDALDEVCSDFERTLERTSMKRKKNNAALMPYSVGNSSDRNNNSTLNGYRAKRHGHAWDASFDIFDSCVTVNKSPRASRSLTRSNTLPFQQKLSPAEQQYESYVKATVAANAKSPVEELFATTTFSRQVTPPPTPPPRRHAAQNKILSPESTSSADFAKSPQSVGALTSPVSISTNEGAGFDAQSYNMRQQMALSLKRMKDLEDQVRSIPEMQFQLTKLREEKNRLQQNLQCKQEELQRAREYARNTASCSPLASPKYASPVHFTPQRISPITLESLGSRLRTNSITSVSSEKQQKSQSILRRDVGTMCGLHATRDIAVGSPVIMLRSVGTSPAQTLRITEMLYTELQLNEQIEIAIQSYEEQQMLQRLKNLISVGTQMYVPMRDVRDSGMQTAAERAVQKYNVGVTARPTTRDNFVSCKPQMRDFGSSEHRITDVLCEKCAKHKRTVACGTDEISDEKNRIAVSLKFLDLTGRSNTFSLGDGEKLNMKRKTTGTQYEGAVVHSTGSQTGLPAVISIGIQHAPQTHDSSVQAQADVKSKQTDTRNLVRLRTTQTSIEEIKPSIPPTPIESLALTPAQAPAPKRAETRETASNTDHPKTKEHGVNTAPPAAIRHSGSNTDTIRKRDIGCGDVVKPHISIACADNYCDSCKEAIRVLAKEFLPAQKTAPPPASPLPVRAADSSKIPRPKYVTSPSPVRKPLQRQNTYTIVSSSAATATAATTDKKSKTGSLQDKTSNINKEESSKETHSFLNELSSSQKITKSTSRTALSEQSQSSASVETVLEREPTLQERSGTYDLTPLIVKEEKRVSISWSRDASPAPSMSQSREGPNSLDSSSFNEKLKEALDTKTDAQTADDIDVSKGARKKISPIKSSQRVQAPEENEALLQKLATVETEPRQKYAPSKELHGALKVINESLLKRMGAKPLSSGSLKAAKTTIQQEWFRISSTEKANPHEVEDYLDTFEAMSVPLLEYCVNLTDQNGNTAMHYAISHGNFDVVSILLDSKVCNVNQMNNAGYTSVMLVSLAKLKNAAHRTVVERLFQMADINIRAKKHCQTALMLAVSHCNGDVVQMLLAAGADINIQDEDGSTALMCAAEHGRAEIVKTLLSQPECDSLIQDVDGSTAFKIAWQAGHRDVGLLLYVHEQMLRSKMPYRGADDAKDDEDDKLLQSSKTTASSTIKKTKK